MMPRDGSRYVDGELARLRERVLDMGALVEEMLRDAVDALRRHDADAAAAVVRRDRRVDALEMEIDDHCVRLLALRQPLARDLRLVASAMKIARDLERVGDHAVHVARVAADLSPERLPAFPEVTEMAGVAMEMLTEALDQFIRGDAGRARAVCERDRVMDGLQETFLHALLRRMMEDPRWIGPGMQILVAARNLERVADLATNVAEEVVYLVDGTALPPRRVLPAA